MVIFENAEAKVSGNYPVIVASLFTAYLFWGRVASEKTVAFTANA